MADANGETSTGVTLILGEIKNDTFRVTLTLDSTWIQAEERAFPVTVDPVIKTKQTVEEMTCTFVDSGHPNTAHGIGASDAGSMYVGRNIYEYGSARTYIKIHSLPDIGGIASKVVDAKFAVWKRNVYSTGDTVRLNAYQVTSSWTASSLTYNVYPTNDTYILDYLLLSADNKTQPNYQDSAWYPELKYLEITDLVRGWYAGEYANNGFMLDSEATNTHKAWLFSNQYSDFTDVRPILYVKYRNMSGYEDHWSYTNLSAGRGGIASVNNFNGNFVFAQPITQDDGGNLMPVELSLAYNANKGEVSNSKIGVGMQTNYNLYIRYDSVLVENGYKYYFNDADGTKHWLKKETENNKTVYKDEDGLGYTLTEISKGSISTAPDAVFEMVDKDENKMYFDWWGNLVQLKNPTGITSSLTYTDAGGDRRLETITDGAGRIYTFSYASSESRQVSKITDPAGRETTFTYDSSSPKKLTAIHFADSQSVVLSYTNNLLSEIRGIDGTRTKISYDSSAQKRVTQINWGASDSNLLEKYTFAYKQNSTTVTDVLLDRSYTYQFNDSGQFTGIVSDKDGSAQFYKWAQPTSVTDSRANKLTQESQVLQTVTNYVVNPGFTRAYSNGYVNYIENTANQSISIDTSRKNITNSALKVYKAASNTGRVNAVQYVNGLSAGTYTFSAYVNTEGATIPNGVSMFVEIWNASNACIGGYFIEQTTKTDGWERKSVTFTLPQGCTARLVMGLGGSASGTVWFDDLQLEKGEGESTFNLVENSGFTNGMTCWASEGGEAGWTANCSLSGFSRCGQLPGTVEGEYKSLLQTIYVSGKKGDVFSFGMWAYASSAPIENGTKDGDPYQPDFEIVLHYYDASGRWKGYIHLNCNPDLKNAWQFVTEEAIIPEDYGKIAISLLYNHNVNAAYMTGAFCFKEQYGQTYDYDINGNVVSTKDLAETNSKFTYCTNQMSSMLNPSGSSYLYAYNDKKQLTYALSSDGQQYGFTYDGNGNVTKAEITARAPATTIESGKEYILVNAYSGLALCSGYQRSSGALITTYRYTPTSAEEYWKLTLVPGTTDVYTLAAVEYTEQNYYLDVKGGGNANGTALELFPYNGGNAQKFKIVKEKDNTFSLFTACSDYTKLVDGQMHGNYVEQSKTVYQTTPYPNADEPCYGQRWYFYPVEATEDKTIVTETTYTANGNFAATSKDQRGNTTAYQYNETKGTLTKTIDALNRETEYTYYPNDNKLKTVSSGGMTNTYTYENDRLDTINVNGALQYKFDYDVFGRTIATKVGNGSTWRTLSSIEYAPNGRIAKQTYGSPDNGDYVENTYDDLDRLTQICYNGSSTNRAVYKYGTNGKLSQTIDYAANTRTKFVYDLANRVVSEREYTGTGVNGGTLRSSTDFTYADKTNYLTGVKHFSPLGTQNIGYTYGDASQGQMPDQIYKVSWNGQEKINNSYDSLGRLSGKSIFTDGAAILYAYGYANVDENHTTTLLSGVRTSFGVYRYTYDAVGNITSVAFGTRYTNTYEYDSLNQLVRENNQQIGKTYTYAYVNGNITEKKEYAYTTGELPAQPQNTYTWAYTDSTWSDLLTNFNGTAISYDEIGNPVSLDDVQLSWNGRQLQQITGAEGEILSYCYNTDGQRISKTMTETNGTVTTTEYFYNGSILAGQKCGDNTLVFMYDNNGQYYGFTYNGATYYYLTNIQGDVDMVLNSSRAVVAKYAYDAWGNVVSVTDADGNDITDMSHIGHINPIRYRGYYYDAETELYYLNSRYYMPVLCRFLNGDCYVQTGQGVLDKNMFAYCGNNPVNRADTNGNRWADVKQKISEAWKTVKNWVSSTFGYNSTYTSETKWETPNDLISNLSPIVYKVGTKNSTSTHRKGSGRKPISIYTKVRTDSKLKSSVGIKIQTERVIVDLSLGVDNIGITSSMISGECQSSFGLKVDLSQFKVGFEAAESVVLWDGDVQNVQTDYTNVSINGWFIAALFLAPALAESGAGAGVAVAAGSA
ncbi:MAG: DNRLRE domain-containing protein [Eubacterium sp.]